MNRRKLLLVAVIIALVASFFVFDLGNYLTLDYIKSRQMDLTNLYETNRLLMLGTYFIGYVLVTTLSFPGATVMTLLGAAVFGFWTALVVVSFASTIGATLACLAARFLLRDWVQSKYGGRLATVNNGVEREGALYLFTMRLIPVFPFFMINLTMGLTPMPLRTYYWVSQLGMLPGTAAYVFAGQELGRIDSLSGILNPQLVAAFAILGILPLAAKKILGFVRARAGAGSNRS